VNLPQVLPVPTPGQLTLRMITPHGYESPFNNIACRRAYNLAN